MNLIASIEQVSSPGFAGGLGEFFNNMAMPLPDSGQFTRTTDLGALVFLDAPACVLRITRDGEFPAIRHRRVLQPLFSRKTGPFRAEFFPGIRSPVSSEQRIVEAVSELYADGIRFPDPQEIRDDNFGELPDGFVVGLDMGAMRNTRGENATQGDNPHYRLYGALQAAFARAWPEDCTLPDHGKLAQAWALCAQMKESGLLTADWHRPGRCYGDFKNAGKGGGAYAAAWVFPG